MLNTMSAILRILSLVLTCLGIEIGGILLFAQEAAAKLIPGDNY